METAAAARGELRERHEITDAQMVLVGMPDFVLLGDCGMMALEGPRLGRASSVPTISKLTRIAKEDCTPAMLPSCGRDARDGSSWAMVDFALAHSKY